MGESVNGTRRVAGGFVGFIGYLLSPLSPWNDMVVNVPVALAFGWFVALFYRPAFMPAAIVGYWLSNVLGFILIQKGAMMAFSKEDRPAFSWRSFWVQMAFSLAYTVVIVVILKLGWIKPPEEMFRH